MAAVAVVATVAVVSVALAVLAAPLCTGNGGDGQLVGFLLDPIYELV